MQRRDAIREAPHRTWRAFGEARRKFWLRDRRVSRALSRAKAGEWYRLLRLRRSASRRQLKEAYRRLAKEVHPDKTTDPRAAEAFDALRDAYDLLADAQKRARYDEELARDDERRRRRRVAQRAAATRAARRVLVAALACMWEHKRVTGAAALVLLAVTLPDPASRPLKM